MERTLDKRKARDKETDDDGSDTSLNKNPMKRARVDYSSPKEKSPSPGSAQKSPLKSSSVTDSIGAAVPALSLIDRSDKGSSGSNGDVASSPSQASSTNNGSGDEANAISKFDLPVPLTNQELEQKMQEKAGDTNEDSDSDNGSTKFLSGIIQNEENKKKRHGKGKGEGGESNAPTPETGGGGGMNMTPILNAKRGSGVQTKSNIKQQGKSSQRQPVLTSSPLYDLSQDSALSNGNIDLEVVLKLNYASNHETFLEETVFVADFRSVDNFLRQHNQYLLPPPSSQSQVGSSGYLGDVSSVDSSASHVHGSSKSGSSNRWTMTSTTSSLGSTIPRSGKVSIATNASESPDELMRRPGRPVSKARKRSDGPIMSSTKYDETNSLDLINVSSNGDEFSTTYLSTKSALKSQSPRTILDQSTSSPTKKTKGNPSKLSDIDEGIGTTGQSTPVSNATARKSGAKATPGSSKVNISNSDSGRSTGKKPAVRRRGGSVNNFPITNVPAPMLNTPPPARSVAKIEGTVTKPLSQFEQEMNNEPVIEADLQKASTLWSTILPEELVFARWRDKNYYSGMVKSKGLNDTWIIDFDDGMEDVASESHIVPIRILGVGVKGVYSPDDRYEAKPAEVIGQKFGVDPETTRQVVKYAIKISGESTPIWCSRRQLSIKENDAKKLRMEYQPPVVPKAGDVSLDNIVSGPRRRTRGGNESESSASDSKLVAGAFDASSADDNQELSTPKLKPGPKPGRKTPASGAKNKRTPLATTVSAPLTKDASTSSPVREIAEKLESPVKTDTPPKKKSVIEIGRKKSKKTRFQGIEFFLTASGGGDPLISGTPIVPVDPYDKDEIREQIESCGGQIIDTVGCETVDDVFLISDSYARTVKYIYCIASSIPCISHSWIKRCIELNEIVDWGVFTLPAGWSMEHQDLIPHHNKKPLKGSKVFVTSESDQLYNYWKPVLIAAEAVLLKPPRKKGQLIPTGTEVLVTDNNTNSTPGLVKEARALKLPLVKPEWLVQTIIMGAKAHMFGHEKYSVLYHDTGESDSEETSAVSVAVAETSESFNDDVLAQMQSPD